MKNINHIKLVTFLASSILLIAFSVNLTSSPQQADAQSSTTNTTATTTRSGHTRLSDYAWSENIGWISFKDGSKPVMIETDGALNGYAWSENLGWIQFGGLSGFPNTTYGGNAKIENGKLTGWARALSGVAPADLAKDNRAGFDGWISLNGSNYGVTTTGTKLAGYGWGSTVTGWIDFSGVSISKLLNSCKGPYGTSIPDGQNFVFYSSPNTSGECGSEIRTCANGQLSGSYTEIACGNTSTCTRGGRTFSSGDKVILFAKAIAGRGETCESLKAELTCTDGQFVDADGKANNLNKALKCTNNPSFTEN